MGRNEKKTDLNSKFRILTMGHTSGIAKGFVLLALIAFAVLLVVVAVLFGIASFIGGWAYVVLGAGGGYAFARFMGWTPKERTAVAVSGGIGGVVAWLVSASIAGIGGAIAAVFAGVIACAIAIVVALWIGAK
jgi:hypothetical protein